MFELATVCDRIALIQAGISALKVQICTLTKKIVKNHWQLFKNFGIIYGICVKAFCF